MGFPIFGFFFIGLTGLLGLLRKLNMLHFTVKSRFRAFEWLVTIIRVIAV